MLGRQHVRRMLTSLHKAGVLKEGYDHMAATNAMQEEWKDKIAAVWSAEDIHSLAAEQGEIITDDQAIEVLEIAGHIQDANQGISWEVLRTHLNWFLRDLKEQA